MARLFFGLFIVLCCVFSYADLTNPPKSIERQYLQNDNKLSNGGAESGKLGWTASDSGSFSIITSGFRNGARAFRFNASATDQTITSGSWTVQSNATTNGLGLCYFKTTATDYLMQIYDGSNVVASQTITATSEYTALPLSFVASGGSSYSIRLRSQSDASDLDSDDCYLGENFLLGQVSQASFIGSARWVPAVNCTWDVSSTSASNYSADADCTTPTGSSLQGSATAPATKIPAISFSQLPPGRYYIYATGIFLKNGVTSSTRACWRFSDGTNVTDSSCVQPSGTTSRAAMGSVHGNLTYTSGQNSVTIQLQAFADGAAESAQIVNDSNVTSVSGLNISLYRYPTASELSYNSQNIPSFWSGYHDATCAWSRTNTAFGDFTDDASCALVQRANVNFGTVSTVGSVSPAISFLPKMAAWYKVCAYFNPALPVALENIAYRMLDGSSNVLDQGNRRSYNSTSEAVGSRQMLCGKMYASNTSAQTVKIQGAFGSGTGVIQSLILSTPTIQWEIEMLSGYSQVNVMNQVSTQQVAGVSMQMAQLDCDAGSSITRQVGTWVSSIGNISSGSCTVNFTAGVFANTPYCFATESTVGNGRIVAARNATTSTLDINCVNDAGSNCADFDINLMCIGPK